MTSDRYRVAEEKVKAVAEGSFGRPVEVVIGTLLGLLVVEVAHVTDALVGLRDTLRNKL